jgi:uncharacterized membrane protein
MRPTPSNTTPNAAPIQPKTSPALARRLAALLKYGTWVASLTIAVGFVLTLSAAPTGGHRVALPAGMPIVTAGIALFILLPVLHLILTLGMFLRQRDYRFSAITVLVLLIVAAGCVVGAHMSVSMSG